MLFLFTLKKSKPVLTMLLALVALFWLLDYLVPLPNVQADSAQTILARDGTPLWRFADKNGIWRYQITEDQVSPFYVEALLAYEDRWFYWHPGVNPLALMRAFKLNISHGRIISGGSTLSMQVARIIDPHERTLLGKLRQVWRTMQLEWHYSKQEILEIYLNRAPFGGTIEGVAAASWAYLGKPATDLTQAEAALLAVLPQAPSRLRPDRYPERAKAARNKLLQRLLKQNTWPQKQIQEAIDEDFWLSPRQEPAYAPLLSRRLANQTDANVINTTIDFNLQQRLEDTLLNWKNTLAPHVSMAVVVADSRSLEVLAYLGSVDLNDNSRAGHVDMVQAIRSPGSTLKPFLYAFALEDGLIHSESLMQDVPRHHASYQPENFSQGFSGPVEASAALINSLNLPAVQLLEHYGSKRFAARLAQADIPLLFPQNGAPNLALILGGVGTNLESLVRAYAAFDNGGKTGQLVFQPQQKAKSPKPLMDAGAAWIVQRILTGQQHPSSLQKLRRSGFAWKTGTSYGHRDALALGVGNGYVIGVWVGRPDGTPVQGQYGQVSATPMLLQIYDSLTYQAEFQPVPKTQPSNVGVAVICWPGGQELALNDENCRKQRVAWTLNGVVPPTLPLLGLPQTLWQKVWLNPQGQRVASHCEHAKPHSIAFWPTPLEAWLPLSEHRVSRLPKASIDCPPPSLPSIGKLRILGVKTNAQISLPPMHEEKGIALEFKLEGSQGEHWWFINGQLIQDSISAPILRHHFITSGKQQISVMDASGQTALLEFTLNK